MSNRAPVYALAAALIAGIAAIVLWPARVSEPGIYRVTTGSMSPAYPAGSAVFIQSAADYRIGDVVLVDRPEFSRPVLHRIVAIDATNVTTKGDANAEADAPISISHIVGKVYP